MGRPRHGCGGVTSLTFTAVADPPPARAPTPNSQLRGQGVAHEVLALEVLILLLEVPSEDSVEMSVEFVKEVGAHLQEVAPQGLHG